jgi:hypothetical protein
MSGFTKLNISPVRRTLKPIGVSVLILILSFAIFSQAPSASQVEEMRKIAFLLGEWKGKGWEILWDGSRGDEFSQKTKVEVKADGSVLRIKDARNYKMTGAFTHSSSLDASIYYDEGAKRYRWRGETSYGRKNPLEAGVIDIRTFQYGVPFKVEAPLPNGARQTTIKVTEAGEWIETLEVWKIDKWHRVEESILKKVK